MYFFSRLLRVDLSFEPYALLAIAIWSVYTFDHLQDARRIPPGSNPDRHQFHIKNRKALTYFLIVSILAAVALGFWYFGFGTTLYLGIGLAVVILLAMILIRVFPHQSAWLKEFNTAFFYVIGVAWLPFYKAESLDLTLPVWGLTFGYLALATLNLLMLSYMDEEKDKKDGSHSILSIISKDKLSQIIRIASVSLLLLTVGMAFAFLSFYRVFAIILFLMIAVHFVSFFHQTWSTERKRVQMELIFSLPWILVFI